jgi:glycosyltransferase involved in cell wall biosynthesis
MPWMTAAMRRPHALLEVEAAEPPAPLALPDGAARAHVLVRWRGRPVGRFWIAPKAGERAIAADKVAEATRSAAGTAIMARALADSVEARDGGGAPPPLPPLTIAICTRGRPELVARCLSHLLAARDAAAGRGPAVDILVVDNAPQDDGTRAAAEAAGVRYAVEPIPGLDFGRNRALAGTDRPFIAYVDDDAAIDRGWLDAFAAAARRSPGLGGVTGPILPFALDTEAQRRFEQAGGFGKGFAWRRFGPARFGDPLYPASAGEIGTGANMIFATDALRAIGGFDEALDTGHPLPGGGDLDAFYRVVRSGRTIVYEPELLMFHEHRKDMPGLRKQYHSWGLSIAALARKLEGADPDMADRHRKVLRWWFRDRLRRLIRAARGRGPQLPGHVLAELTGAIKGAFGEYERSLRRVAERRRTFGR